MRSVNEPRVAHDATVEIGQGRKARAINLSTGGILITAEESLDLGTAVQLRVNLKDGASPLDVSAEVLRRADEGLALRFVDLDDVAKKRIQRLVQKREPTQFGKRDVRIHLPSLSAPLRASARDLTERGVMIEAELPWLRLGSQVTTELSADRACDGRVQWIGLDVTRSGSARLRIFVDLTEQRADGTPAGPPPAITNAEDALPVGAEVERRAPPRLRWLWPSMALGGLVVSALLSVALLRQPVAPLLLPTAPPEVEARVAKTPATTKVPSEIAVGASDTPAIATPAAATPAAKPTKPVPHKAARAKKHARALTPRAG